MSKFALLKIAVFLFFFSSLSLTSTAQEIIPISIEAYHHAQVVDASLKEVPNLQRDVVSSIEEAKKDTQMLAHEAAGVLAGSQSAPMAFDPLPIVEVGRPTLGEKDIEIKWQSRAQRSVIWVDISNSNTVDYDPERIYETTYFRRLISTDGVHWIQSKAVKMSIEQTGYKYVSNEK